MQHDFELAKEKILMGSERRSLTISDRERRMTAFHEAGHALIAMLSEHGDPLHKVTIVPRGGALGVTMTLPEEDRHTATREQMIAMIRHAMGGRAAEEVVFNQLTTGAADDLKKATRVAREMVCSYGMSEKLGPISISDESDTVFLGREFAAGPKYGPECAREIDAEILSLLTDAYAFAKTQLMGHRDALDRIAEALLERETLGEPEIQLLLQGTPLPPLPVPETLEKPAVGAALSAGEKEEKPSGFPDKPIPDPEPVPS